MRFEFGASEVWMFPDHAILFGRVHDVDILLGDLFTACSWTPWLALPVNGSRVGPVTVSHEVALRVEGIEAYNQPLDLLSTGMTGGLKLVGAGLELLRQIDPAARDGGWLLAGERQPEK